MFLLIQNFCDAASDHRQLLRVYAADIGFDNAFIRFIAAEVDGVFTLLQRVNQIAGFCVVSHEATIGGRACIHTSQISHHAQISDNVTVTQSQVRGYCRLADEARLLPHCQVIAARGLTADRDKVLQIYQRATVSASRILHQAQIYGDAFVEHAFVEHRAEVFDQARLEGNEENDVWVCDNARR